ARRRARWHASSPTAWRRCAPSSPTLRSRRRPTEPRRRRGDSAALRILIVKLSSLGDVVHALPVVADIHAAHPQATIDWVVEPGFAPLLRRVDGIAEVIELPLRRWRRNGWLRAAMRHEMRAFLQRLRRAR